MTMEIKFKCWNGEITSDPFFPWELVHDDRGGLATIAGISVWWPEVNGPQSFAWRQHTGIKDRNGKEIYEGDILEFDAKEWGDDRTNKFSVTRSESDGAWQGCGSPSEWKYFCTVIGNIHENGDLLK